MPIYEYVCTNCNHEIEAIQSFSEKPLLKCEKCKKNSLEKKISNVSGFLFKGSGFYKTDYPDKNK
jgi:putative FmdB family regulatory protein